VRYRSICSIVRSNKRENEQVVDLSTIWQKTVIANDSFRKGVTFDNTFKRYQKNGGKSILKEILQLVLVKRN